MHHHRHVDIVKMSFVDKFTLAAEKMDLPLFHQTLAVINFHIFFRRYGKKHGAPRQILHHARSDDSCTCRQHGRHLEEMATRMGGSRERIRFRTVRCSHRVQFCKNGYGRAFLPAIDAGLHTGKGKSRLRRKSQFFHITFHF